jgi:hypothetical protein
MQNKHILYGVVLLAATFITSCKEAKNNAVFTTANPSSTAYKAELSKQLQARDAGDLTYTVKQYLVVDGKEYLDLNIKGAGMDANGLVYVNNWTNIEQLRKNKGAGYSGAELKGVQLTINNNSLSLQNADSIVD